MRDTSLLEEFKDRKADATAGLRTQHEKARKALALYAGDMAAYSTGGNEKGMKNMVMINRGKSYIDSFVGFAIQNRRGIKFEARMPSSERQQLYSFYMNGAAKALRDTANADQFESLQDKQMAICGYGAIEKALVFGDEGASRDPHGEVAYECVPYNQVFWDKDARWPNNLDAKYLYRRKCYELEEAKKLFKGSDDSDFTNDSTPSTGKFTYYPGGGNYDKIAEDSGDQTKNEVYVYNYQYWNREKYYRVVNPIISLKQENPALAESAYRGMKRAAELMLSATSRKESPDMFDFNADAPMLIMAPKMFQKMMPLFREAGIELSFDEAFRRIYYTALMSDNTVFDTFKSIDQHGFSIKFKTADYDEANKCWIGMMAAMENPIIYNNKILTELMRIIASNSKGGLLYERGATNNPVELERNWAMTDKSIELNDGGLMKIKPKAEPYVPNGYENLISLFDTYLGQVTFDKSFLGSSENKMEAASLQRQRVKQVTTVLAPMFDSITLYQKEDARSNESYVRVLSEIDPTRTIRLVGEDGQRQVIEMSPDYLTDAYDIELSEAADSATEKDEKLTFMMGFANSAATVGKDVFAEVVPHMHFLSAEERQNMLKAMLPAQPTAEQIQEQAALKQLAIMKEQAEIANKHSDTKLKDATTMEKMANAEQKGMENQVIANHPEVAPSLTI